MITSLYTPKSTPQTRLSEILGLAAGFFQAIVRAGAVQSTTPSRASYPHPHPFTNFPICSDGSAGHSRYNITKPRR